MATSHLSERSVSQYVLLLAAAMTLLLGCNANATPPTVPLGTPAPTHTPNLPSTSPTSTGIRQITPSPPFVKETLPNPPLKKGRWEDFAEAPDRDLYQLAAQLSPGGSLDIPKVVNPEPVSYTEGHKESFWLVDLPDLKLYQRQFELRRVSPGAYWYVEEAQDVRQSDLQRAATIFEEQIYPRVTAAFGREWSPGVDNDPHLNIVHAGLRGVGGYFSSSDEYPRSVYPYSNQRETIYINTSSLQIGSTGYLEVLAHELQHAVHFNGDATEDTWVNEGLSELAVTLAGYQPASITQFLRSPTVSLVHWPLEQRDAGPNYGAAALFFHYLSEHYGTREDLRLLVAEPEDSTRGIDAYLKALGYKLTFRDVFRDWVVANILDETRGVYGYQDLEVQARVLNSIDRSSQVRERSSAVPQYAAAYTELTAFQGPVRLRFRGQAENSLISVDVGDQGCWWSNSGDSINSTLTRAVDLTGLKQATLRYQVWHQVEKSWDYGYVEISADGGQSWDILEAAHTSPENPIGNGFGPGYTGDSSGWISEAIDLSRYGGRPVLLRFQYVTDDAINGAGLCFRQIAVPEAGLVGDDPGWQPNGFIRTNNRVRQEYMVQVIQVGQNNQVTPLPLDETNAGQIVVPDPEKLGRLVVAVAALAPKTLLPASYTLTVEAAT